MLLRCSCLTPRGLAPGDVQRLLSEPAPEGAPGALECCVCLQEILPSSPSLRHLENARSDFCWPKVEELEWFTYRCTIKYAYIIILYIYASIYSYMLRIYVSYLLLHLPVFAKDVLLRHESSDLFLSGQVYIAAPSFTTTNASWSGLRSWRAAPCVVRPWGLR